MAVRKRAAKKTTAAVKPVVEKAAEAPAAKAEEKAVAVNARPFSIKSIKVEKYWRYI